MRFRLDRRRFLSLSGAALGGLGLGGASLLRPTTSQAGAATALRRVLFIYAEGGWTAPDIMMRPPGAPPAWSEYNPWNVQEFGLVPDDLEWEFSLTDENLTEADFSRVLRPLYRHRDQMIVTEGLARLSDALDPHGDAHAKGHISCMSGTASAYGYDGVKSHGATPSMDQRIHEFLRIEEPFLQSLDFRVRANRQNGSLFHEYLYASNGMGGADRLPTQANPDEAFAFLFGDAEPSEPSPFDDAQDLVLSMSVDQFDRLTPRLGHADRIKLEAHRQMLSDLQLGLTNPFDCGSVPSPDSVEGMSRAAQYEADIDSFATLIGAAFACGSARVGTLGLVQIPPEAYGLPQSASIHHEYEHESSPFQGFHINTPFQGYTGTTAVWDNAYEGMVARNIWQSEQVARVLDILRAIPEDGGSLLDNTLVVYVSELSHGSHGTEHYPIMLFGGFAGAVTPGRYIKYAQNNPNPWHRNYSNEWTGTPHSKLLVSILQGFGMDIDYLEAPSVEGSVPHLGINGTVDLSGPLPRLV
jgi:hypothetical protein